MLYFQELGMRSCFPWDLYKPGGAEKSNQTETDKSKENFSSISEDCPKECNRTEYLMSITEGEMESEVMRQFIIESDMDPDDFDIE